jgi:hypothetical protein
MIRVKKDLRKAIMGEVFPSVLQASHTVIAVIRERERKRKKGIEGLLHVGKAGMWNITRESIRAERSTIAEIKIIQCVRGTLTVVADLESTIERESQTVNCNLQKLEKTLAVLACCPISEGE